MNLEQRDIEPGGHYYNSYMTPHMFSLTDFFKNYTIEKWGDHNLIRVPLVYWLDKLRDIAGRPIVVYCGYEERDRGFHPRGVAVDFHIKGMSLVDQFLLATKLPFNGVGVYPFWNRPGLHCDVRSLADDGIKDFWMRDKHGNYKNLDSIEQIR